MDFSGWFEAYLDGRWLTFDARHNTPRVGRVLMARGKDAVDVAITTSFGPTLLEKFIVYTDQVPEPQPSGAAQVRGDRVAMLALNASRRIRRGQAFLVGGFSAIGHSVSRSGGRSPPAPLDVHADRHVAMTWPGSRSGLSEHRRPATGRPGDAMKR